jgi:hypothetical protein
MWTMTTFTGVAGMTGERDGRGLARIVQSGWRINRALSGTVALMLGVLAVSALGLAIDPRLVTGAPIWLKPAKFAVSISVYVASVLWLFTYLEPWRKTRAIVGWVTALTLVSEMVIILAQVSRGTSSHFNTSTPLNAMLWSAMGMAIAVQTMASIGLAVAVWRARFVDRAMGWAFRLGLTLSILGASSGGFMTTPTAAQLETMRSGQRPMAVGAHTVGALDGGAGLPGTGWSTAHGDLRVPHFIGLHAFQALPLLALAARRRGWPERGRVRVILAAAASYALLFAVLLVEALRGFSLVRPDAATLTALTLWAVISGLAFKLALPTTAPDSQHAR